MIIDTHSHFVPRAWPDLSERLGTSDWPTLRHDNPDRGMLMLGDKEFRPVVSALWDAQIRLEEMDRVGVDYQVFCQTPLLFQYHRPGEQGAEIAKLFNDLAIEFADQGKGRLFALAQVPLQDIDRACREVDRAMSIGHIGVQIGNHVGDADLDDEGLTTFLQHCASANCSVLIHPWDMLTGNRMKKYMLPWLVAMPAETQLSILSLILSGAFERIPRSLNLCFAHGGGSFAFLLGRVDNAWERRDIVRQDCPHRPSSYVDHFYVDSAVFDQSALSLLTKVMGDDRVVLGSDYPFPLGEETIGLLVRDHPELSDETKQRILGGTALEFYPRMAAAIGSTGLAEAIR